MKLYKSSLLLVGLLVQSTVFAAQLVITTTGITQLGSSIAFTPSVVNDSIIRISSSDVVLDLGEVQLSQNGGSSGLRGIEVDANLVNVTIRNGIINGITGIGILVNNNCSNITVENMQCISCASRGIDFNGTTAITHSVIKDCFIVRCAQNTSSGDRGLSLNGCRNFIVEDIRIQASGNSTLNFSACRLNRCDAVEVSNVFAIGNIGLNFIGFDLIDSSNCLITDCSVRSNSSSGAGGLARGFNLLGSSGTLANTIFTRCYAIRNSSLNSAIGFLINASCEQNQFIECIAQGNSGGSAEGFVFTGNLTNNENSCDGCLALAQAATGAGNEANGFRVSDSDLRIIQNSIGAFQTSAASNARGLYFPAPVGSNWSIINNIFARNFGSGAGTSFGVQVVGGPVNNNLFSQNIGFNNNTTVGNQLSGVSSVTTPAAPATNNLNAVTSPWTNLAVAA